jgi:hypothetical protein
MAEKIFLDIPYDKDLMDQVKRVPGARWHPDARHWEVDDSPGAWEAIARAGLRDRARSSGKPIPVPAGKIKTDIFDRVAGEQAAPEALLLREGRARQTIKSYGSAVRSASGWLRETRTGYCVCKPR